MTLGLAFVIFYTFLSSAAFEDDPFAPPRAPDGSNLEASYDPFAAPSDSSSMSDGISDHPREPTLSDERLRQLGYTELRRLTEVPAQERGEFRIRQIRRLLGAQAFSVPSGTTLEIGANFARFSGSLANADESLSALISRLGNSLNVDSVFKSDESGGFQAVILRTAAAAFILPPPTDSGFRFVTVLPNDTGVLADGMVLVTNQAEQRPAAQNFSVGSHEGLALEAELLKEGDRSDIELADGTVYPNARITSIALDSIIILVPEGILTLKPHDLSPATQSRFTFDAETAAQERAERERKLSERRQRDHAANEDQRIRQWWADYVHLNAIDAEVEVFQVTSAGIIVTGEGYGTARMGWGTHRQVRNSIFGGEIVHERPERSMKRPHIDFKTLDDRVFIQCDTSLITDKQRLKIRIWPVGTYLYETLRGGTSSIPKYTTSSAEFLAYSRNQGVAP